jgi:hypothetical protein
MTPEERRERLANYWTHYYDELRRRLPDYTTDPQSVPHALRGHERRIQARECKDGYVIVHFSDPENAHSSDHPERLELITDHRDETVGELMGGEIPQDSVPSEAPFWVTHAPFLRNQTTGEYRLMAGWERRDLIANRRIKQWNNNNNEEEEGWRERSGEEAVAQAGEDLRNFFDRKS